MILPSVKALGRVFHQLWRQRNEQSEPLERRLNQIELRHGVVGTMLCARKVASVSATGVYVGEDLLV